MVAGGNPGGLIYGLPTRLPMTESHLDPRLTERRNPRTTEIDRASTLEIIDLISVEDAAVPTAVGRAREEIARAIDLIVAAFRSGGKLYYIGAGTSGRLGVLDAAECPPTFGTEPELATACATTTQTAAAAGSRHDFVSALF